MTRHRNRLVLAGFTVLGAYCSTGLAGGYAIVDVAVFPTCSITPIDHVVLEVLVATPTMSAFFTQPPVVSVEGSQVSVTVFPDSGFGQAEDSVVAVIDLGTFQPGMYQFTVNGVFADSFNVKTDVCPAIAGRVQWMYFADRFSSSIKRSTRDGARVESLPIPGLEAPNGLAVDPESNKMYWADSGASTINRANVDGSAPEILVDSSPVFPAPITLDRSTHTMYWVARNSGHSEDIMRADFDGGNLAVVVEDLDLTGPLTVDGNTGMIFWTAWETLGGPQKIQRAYIYGGGLRDLVTGLGSPSNLLVDGDSNKLYWADSRTDKIQRSNLDGTEIEDVVAAGLSRPHEIALDPVEGRLYWIDADTGTIRRTYLDGTGVEDLVTVEELVMAWEGSFWLVLDVINRKMYWERDTEDILAGGFIHRANLDGSGVEEVIAGLGRPSAVDFVVLGNRVPTVSSWTAFAMAALILGIGTRIIKRRSMA